ncbi:ABC transporter permease subunit [Patescibacteria group bacterium]|nr:ABC transporter permease subunit [Patescibacteria group bacterium]
MNLNSKKHFGNLIYIVTILFFLFIIFFPAIYVLTYAVGGKIKISGELINALSVSFSVAFIVTIVNLIFGVALAWVFVKSKSKYKIWLDNLIDLPLIVPTAALGLSVYLFWGEFWNLEKGFLMIILLHVIFTLPYMVRSVAASMEQINDTYNEAATTLGATAFTLFRTIDFPLFKDGVITGAVLTFTRSLSETGATMMVASLATITAPVLVVNLKNSGDVPQAAIASIILILSALIILFAAKFLTRKKHFNFNIIYPKFEKSISNLASARNFVLTLFFLFIILIPTFYIIFYNFANFSPVFNAQILQSFVTSFGIALSVTIVGLIFAIPMAYFIARSKNEKLASLFENMHDAVLLVPTSALGFSLAMFWGKLEFNELLILALSHLSFTFPLLVKPITTAIRNVDFSFEESALCLGASKQKVLTSILFPLILPAIIAGSIMAFMRSLSETGATLAVSHDIKTVSVLIVDLVKNEQRAEAGFLCFVLFLIAFIFLIALKKTKKKM